MPLPLLLRGAAALTLSSFALAAPAGAATLGERPLKKGAHGSDVITLQRVLLMKGYRLGRADGVFGRVTKRTVKRFQRRRRLTADGVVGPLTVHALAYTWKVRTATLYGPGLYGNRTACGYRLGRRTRGVAHRSLPCGTPVPVYYGGRLAIYPVIDRGPFSSGVAIDLTAAAARKLGMSTTSAVRAGY
jgi:peptidoglycan hydrolase-like protein with peptidoglycan-binding domain